MKNVLIMFGVLSVALMGTWGMCAIHGQTAAQSLGGLSFQQGLYAPMDLTWLDGLFQSLYGATPFILAADKEEEPKPETKEDEPTPPPSRLRPSFDRPAAWSFTHPGGRLRFYIS